MKAQRTAETETERLLRKADAAHAELTGILERVSDGFVAFDCDLRYTYVNAKAGELFGRSPERMLRKLYLDEYPEAEGSSFHRAYQRALEEQRPVVFEDYYEPWDRWFENRVYPSADGLAVFFTEITDRKRAELALRDTTELLDALVRSSPVVIATIDLDGKLTSWSPAGERIFGWPEEKLLGRGPVIVPEDLLSEAQALYRRAAAGETILGVETKRLRKDGTLADVSLSLAPLRGAKGAVTGIVGVLEDISERIRVEAELKQRNEELSALHETTLSLIKQEGTESVLEEIVARGGALVAAPYAYLYQLDPGGETLTATVALGEAARYRGVSIRRGEGLAGRVLETGSSQTVDDYSSWPGRASHFEESVLHAVAAVPMRSGDEIVGVFGAARLEEGRRFDTADLALLDRFAHLASLVLANSRVTDRLRSSEEQLRLAAEAARMGVWSSDLAHRVIFTDAITTEILGQDVCTDDECFELVHPEDRPRVRAAFEAAIEGGLPYSSRFRIVTPAGETKWLEDSGSVVRDEAGAPQRMIGVVFDVTERELADAQIRESEERLRLAARTVGMGVWEIDAATGHVTHDDVARKWFWLEPGESIDSMEEFLEFVHVDDRDRVGAAVQAALDGGAPYAAELRLVSSDGEVRWLSAAGAVIPDGRGMPVRMLGASFDVTEAKAAEEELRQLTADLEQRVVARTREVNAARAEAERANAAKSVFLSRMSHELRTPLNAILGFGQLLALDGLDTEQHDSLEQILRAGGHLLELIDEVLDVSKIEAGVLDIALESVALAGVVQEAIDLVQPLVARHRIELPSCPEEAYHLRALADRHRLLQVVLNLLSNAVKYNREGGRVDVACAVVEGDRVRVDIRDTGPGIADKDLDRLFVPFERLESGFAIEGTGLGLALAKSLVEAMGGSIGAESRLGEGSRFFFELPTAGDYVAVAAGGQTEPPEIEAPAAARTILLVEDNLSNAKLVEKVIERVPGVRLLTVREGGDALELAFHSTPDLILLDLDLPDLSGEEVLRRLCEEPATGEIPVVVVSADARCEAIERLLAAGALDYLTKPIDVDRLLDVVAKA